MLTGISLIATPRWFLEYQCDIRLDNVSPHLARVIGVLLLSLSMQSHRAFLVDDRLQTATLSSSRVVTALMLLLATSYASYHYRDWNYKFAQLSVFGAVCWLLPHLYYALTTAHITSAQMHGVTFFLLLDHFMTVAVGLAWYAYPQWVLRTFIEIQANGVSVTLGRVLGLLLIALSLESRAATLYNNTTSKKLVHASRILVSLPLLVLVFYAGALQRAFNVIHLFVGVAAVVVWGINSVLGYGVIAVVQHSFENNRKCGHVFNLEANKHVSPFEKVKDYNPNYQGAVTCPDTNEMALLRQRVPSSKCLEDWTAADRS